jgi:hypothetical protein
MVSAEDNTQVTACPWEIVTLLGVKVRAFPTPTVTVVCAQRCTPLRLKTNRNNKIVRFSGIHFSIVQINYRRA